MPAQPLLKLNLLEQFNVSSSGQKKNFIENVKSILTPLTELEANFAIEQLMKQLVSFKSNPSKEMLGKLKEIFSPKEILDSRVKSFDVKLHKINSRLLNDNAIKKKNKTKTVETILHTLDVKSLKSSPLKTAKRTLRSNTESEMQYKYTVVFNETDQSKNLRSILKKPEDSEVIILSKKKIMLSNNVEVKYFKK